VVIDYTNGSRLNHGLVVLFVGGFVALIGFGATLKPKARTRVEPAEVDDRETADA
jgi:hypothetical protein